MSELATYSRFFTKEEAAPMLQLLNESGIAYEIDVERDILDSIYTGSSNDPMITLRIPASDFEKVNALAESRFQPDMAEIDPGYYLFYFSDEELKDVVRQPGEWNHFDRSLARQLLSGKNIPVPINELLTEENYTPVKLTPLWVGLEILLSIVFAYAGIVIGLATILATKRLRNGTKVKIYDNDSIASARIILIIGIIRTAYHFYIILGI